MSKKPRPKRTKSADPETVRQKTATDAPMTLAEAAVFLDLHTKSVTRLIRTHGLPAHRMGPRELRFFATELAEWIKRPRATDRPTDPDRRERWVDEGAGWSRDPSPSKFVGEPDSVTLRRLNTDPAATEAVQRLARETGKRREPPELEISTLSERFPGQCAAAVRKGKARCMTPAPEGQTFCHRHRAMQDAWLGKKRGES